MRVLICSSTYPPVLNGQSVFTRNLAENLVLHGHEVRVIVPDQPARPASEIVNGVHLVAVPSLQLGFIHADLIWPVRFRQILREQFDQFDPEIVHVQDPSVFCQEAIREARKRQIPSLSTHHTGPKITAPIVLPKNKLLRAFCEHTVWKFLLKHLSQVDLVLVPSQFSVQMLSEKGLKTPVKRVPGAVALEKFAVSHKRIQKDPKAWGLDTDMISLLYVGRLDVEKRVCDLIQALARLDREDVRLVIAGQGAMESQLQALAKQLGVSEEVCFLGQVEHDDLPGLFSRMDIFCMPGDAESFSIATLEAMACGLPVLAAGSSALPELVEHGQTGYLFKPGDVDDLVRGIRYLTAQRGLWGQMGEKAVRKAEQYSFSRFEHYHEQAYFSAMRLADKNRTVPLPASKPQPRRFHAFYRGLILSILFVLVLVLELGTHYDQLQAAPILPLEDFIPEMVSDIHRLLLFSTHPEEETPVASGMIQIVLQNGGWVQVAVVNDDARRTWGNYISARAFHINTWEYGLSLRQKQEQVKAAFLDLGIPEDQIIFLDSPRQDEGLSGEYSLSLREPEFLRRFNHVIDNFLDQTFIDSGDQLEHKFTEEIYQILLDFEPDAILIPNLSHHLIGQSEEGDFSGLLLRMPSAQPDLVLNLWSQSAASESIP